MQQRLSFLTLGVKNLDQMKRFYRDTFGWTTLKDSDGIVFYKLNGIILGLYPDKELSGDIGIAYIESEHSYKGFTLAINVNSESAVNEIFQELERKGVTIIKQPERVFWGGYRGYIADPEFNYWEIAYNPFLELDHQGNVVSHQ